MLVEAAKRARRCSKTKPTAQAAIPPLLHDLKTHDVGIHSPSEPDGRYDTPSLIGAYRTALFHDGRAATLREARSTTIPSTAREPPRPHRGNRYLIAYVLSL